MVLVPRCRIPVKGLRVRVICGKCEIDFAVGVFGPSAVEERPRPPSPLERSASPRHILNKF